jgi:molecular chaperone GrpE
MLRQLEQAGLERIAAVNVPFDPNIHEAIMQVPAESPDQDHTVALVLQTGYRFGRQLLRPARVQVRVWSGESDAN